MEKNKVETSSFSENKERIEEYIELLEDLIKPMKERFEKADDEEKSTDKYQKAQRSLDRFEKLLSGKGLKSQLALGYLTGERLGKYYEVDFRPSTDLDMGEVMDLATQVVYEASELTPQK